MLELEYVFFFDKKIWCRVMVFFVPAWWSYPWKFRVVQTMLCLNISIWRFSSLFFSAYRKERGSLSFGMITSFSWRNIMVWNFESWYVNGSLGHFWSNLLQPTVLLGCFDFLYKIRGVYLCDFVNVYSANHFFISFWQDSFELGKREQAPGNVDIELGLQGDLTSSAQPGFEGFYEQVRVFLSGRVDLFLKEHLKKWSTT